MEIYTSFDNTNTNDDATGQAQGSVITIGKFDGIHRGHLLLLNRVMEVATQKNLSRSVVSFFPMVSTADQDASDDDSQYLMTSLERECFFERIRIDRYYQIPFDEALRSMKPEEFLSEILLKKLGARHIVVGDDFCFGYKRSGDVAFLKKASEEYGFDLDVIERCQEDGRIISSHWVRDAVSAGQMDVASRLLGRYYSVIGTVCHGDGRGHTMQMPTVNIEADPIKCLPPNGVYRSHCFLPDGKVVRSVTNIGNKPTFGGKETNIETHLLLGDPLDLYDKTVEVTLEEYLRPEKTFADADELLAQIKEDIRTAWAR